MAQKSSDPDDQPNPSSSANKDLPDSGIVQTKFTSHTPTSAPTTQPSKPTNLKVSGENAAATSQPMTKSTSSGSNPSSKEAMAGPSPYGTRSRNRGQARPNYAEDKDVDVEMYDAYPEKKEDEPKKSSRQSIASTNGSGDVLKSTTSTSRKGAAPDDGKAGAGLHATVKDPHPATHTNLNIPPPAVTTSSSKKRKAPAQSTTSNANSHASTPAPSSTTTTTRRSIANATATNNTNANTHTAATNTSTSTAIAATTTPAVITTNTTQVRAGYKVTNMLSFERTGAIPKDGKLVADDGTVLQANGMN